MLFVLGAQPVHSTVQTSTSSYPGLQVSTYPQQPQQQQQQPQQQQLPQQPAAGAQSAQILPPMYANYSYGYMAHPQPAAGPYHQSMPASGYGSQSYPQAGYQYSQVSDTVSSAYQQPNQGSSQQPVVTTNSGPPQFLYQYPQGSKPVGSQPSYSFTGQVPVTMGTGAQQPQVDVGQGAPTSAPLQTVQQHPGQTAPASSTQYAQVHPAITTSVSSTTNYPYHQAQMTPGANPGYSYTAGYGYNQPPSYPYPYGQAQAYPGSSQVRPSYSPAQAQPQQSQLPVSTPGQAGFQQNYPNVTQPSPKTPQVQLPATTNTHPGHSGFQHTYPGAQAYQTSQNYLSGQQQHQQQPQQQPFQQQHQFYNSSQYGYTPTTAYPQTVNSNVPTTASESPVKTNLPVTGPQQQQQQV